MLEHVVPTIHEICGLLVAGEPCVQSYFISNYYSKRATMFWTLLSGSWEFGHKTRGLLGTWQMEFIFSKIFEKHFITFEIQYGINSSIQPKARGLLHMECDCSSHPIYENYYLRASRLLEQEHHTALVQFKKYSEGCLHEVQELLDGGFRSTRQPATTRL